jgi:hypothetical protein
MVNITVLEVHLDDASFSASAERPFSNVTGSEDDGTEQTTGDGEQDDTDETALGRTDDGPEMPKKALATVGVLVGLAGIAALVKGLAGDDDPEVDIETPEDDENRPVGVTVDE